MSTLQGCTPRPLWQPEGAAEGAVEGCIDSGSHIIRICAKNGAGRMEMHNRGFLSFFFHSFVFVWRRGLPPRVPRLAFMHCV